MVLIVIYVKAQATLKFVFERESLYTSQNSQDQLMRYLRHLCWCSTSFSQNWSLFQACDLATLLQRCDHHL